MIASLVLGHSDFFRVECTEQGPHESMIKKLRLLIFIFIAVKVSALQVEESFGQLLVLLHYQTAALCMLECKRSILGR